MDTNFGRQHILSLPNNICCIYKITSPSGKVYIGQTTNLKRRLNAYRNQLCKGQRHLYHSLMKYGAEKHSYQIVHELPNDVTSDILNDLEILYIFLYSNCGIALLNGSEGGGGLRRKMTEEQKKKMRGRIVSEETRQRIKESIKAKGDYRKPLTEEHKEKIRQRHKGKPRPDSVKQRIKEALKENGNGWAGRKHSEETRQKMALAHLGKKQTEEHIKKAQQNKGKIKHSEESKRKISQSLLKHYRSIL